MLTWLERSLRVVTDVLSVVMGWVITVLAVVITVETLLRKFAKISIQGLDEYGGYVLAISSAVGFTAAFLARGHIRVDVVVRLLPVRLRAWADVIALGTLGFYATMVFLYGLQLLSSSWALEAHAVSPLETPLVIPQGLWVAALALFVFACAVISVAVLFALARRNFAEVARWAGVPTGDDQVKEELDALRRRDTEAAGLSAGSDSQ